MRKQQRLINNLIIEAAKTDVVTPWTRGARRDAWIVKRATHATELKVAHS